MKAAAIQATRPPQQKPHDRNTVAVHRRRLVLPQVGQHGLQVPPHLVVRHLADDAVQDRVHVAHLAGVAVPMQQLGCHGGIALLGEAPAHVADVLMHAEDLLGHDHQRERPRPLWPRGVGRQDAIVGRHGDRPLDQPGRVRVDNMRQVEAGRGRVGLPHQPLAFAAFRLAASIP